VRRRVSSYSLSITADNDSTAMSFSACRLRGALYPLRPATYARYARPKFQLATLAGFLLTGCETIGEMVIDCINVYQPLCVICRMCRIYASGGNRDTCGSVLSVTLRGGGRSLLTATTVNLQCVSALPETVFQSSLVRSISIISTPW
jgi:hypothetical protein